MKKNMILLVACLSVLVLFSGCAKTSDYVKKSFNNITTLFFDNDTAEPFISGA